MGHNTFRTVTSTRKLIAILIFGFVWPALETPVPLAQTTTAITPTTGGGSLGTTVTTQGQTVQITDGTRPGNGPNLFHSFDQFNVGRGDTAQFLNITPSIPTSNILSRVTGGNPSSIFGTIDTLSYQGANLFLMNPAGIVFGPNATLHVGGSVAFTTADYLRLAEANGSPAGIFHADTTATSLLTSASVAAFGFLGRNPAAIKVQESMLTVQPGQSISLVGGNDGFTSTDPGTGSAVSVPNGVTMTGGTLSAQNGQVNIASVASQGEILAGTLDQTANIDGQSFDTLGTIQISKQSRIDTSGEGGGTILVRGGRLVVDDSTISANTKTAGPDTSPKVGPLVAGIDIHVAQDAVIDNVALIETNVEPGAHHGSGGVRITADHITISGGPRGLAFVAMNPMADRPFGVRSNVVQNSNAARSGDISLNATSSIQIKDAGQIETNASPGSSGNLGNIVVNSSHGNVNLTGKAKVSSFAQTNSSGNTGSIKVDAPRGDIILVNSDLFNSANGTGTLRDIQIAAHNLHLRHFSSIGGDNSITGENTSTQIPGNTIITLSGQLSLAGGSFINTGTFSSADSADLIIRAPDILITGKDSDGFNSGIYTSTISSGNGGQLRLFADNLQLTDGGILSGKSFIGVEGQIPSGSGGVINIQGPRSPGTSVSIDGPGSGIFTNTEGTGAAGAIYLSARSLTMSNGATISASSTGTSSSPGLGPGPGNIFINAGQSLEMRDSSITTESELTNGGNIDIQAIDRVHLANSSISTSAPNGTGNGGNITIDPNVVVLQNSKVLARAVQGSGGNIMITTPLFLADPRSLVDASSQFGLNGSVTIQSPTSNLSGTVGQLASKTSPPQVLLQNRCVALAGGEQSTFILAGRDALPSEPGGWLSSPVAMEHWTGEVPADHVSRLMVWSRGLNTQPLLVMSKDEPTVLSLRRLAPPGFLVRSFAANAPTGCSS